VRFRRLHQELGAEVTGIDLEHPRPDEVDALRDSFDEYGLLLLRCGRIPPERQVEIVRWFGPPVDDSGVGRFWGVLHNEDRAGSMLLPFHSDFTYTESPIKVISLHAIELPAGGTSTSFVSGAAAWERLGPEQHERLAPLSIRHSYESRIGDEYPSFVADHPLRFLHPRTGKPVLFVTEMHADRILDLDVDESTHVLDELMSELYAPEHVYVHNWRLHDLLVWDNLVVQHARTEEADVSAGTRVLQRATANEVTYAELIDRARARERAGVDSPG
jgi:taurine dioxygenase